MEQEQSPVTPILPPQSKNHYRLLFWGIIALLLFLFAGGVFAYKGGYVQFYIPTTVSNNPSDNESQSNDSKNNITAVEPDLIDETPIGTIKWNKINLMDPIANIPYDTTDEYFNYWYQMYDAGTFLDGVYEGARLEFGIELYNHYEEEFYDGGSFDGRTFFYAIVDKDGTLLGWWKDPTESYPIELNLDDTLILDYDTFPTQLITYEKSVLSVTPFGTLRVYPTFQIEQRAHDFWEVVTPDEEVFTYKNNPVLFIEQYFGEGFYSNISSESYFVMLPTGMLLRADVLPSFISSDSSVPTVTWTNGTTTVAEYVFNSSFYATEDCFVTAGSFDEAVSSFIQTGTTATGDPLYELDSQKHGTVYECLYENTERHDYDIYTETSTSYYPLSYADFLESHPVFFWTNFFGEWKIFSKTDTMPAAEKAKPVIYLYPETEQEVIVHVDPVGGFTVTDPFYDDGWVVTAQPDGTLTNLKDGIQYPYLFWEGGDEGVVMSPREGFVVKKENVASVLEEKLIYFGLNEQERIDFKDYWVPKLSKTPYYFITFISRSEIDRVAPWSITPEPDTTIRVLMDYRPLDKEISVEPLEIIPTERKGFTVVEWGGIVHD